MTEFTPEWIAGAREQMKHISPLPWKACSCGKCGMITGEKDLIATATRGDWGDDYPIIKPVGGSIGGQYEVVMEQITYGHIPPETGNINAQYIAEACTNYPEALDEIELLQNRIAELEERNNNLIVENSRIAGKLAHYYVRVQELEEERRWIPVGERLPEDNQHVFVHTDFGCEEAYRGRFYGMNHHSIQWLNHSGFVLGGVVTHWQTLPQPPKDGEE